MSCCGRTRTPVRETMTTAVAAPYATGAAVSVPLRPASDTVWLRYVGGSSIEVRGPITRRAYTFSPTRLVQRVDARDVAALVRTRLFLETW